MLVSAFPSAEKIKKAKIHRFFTIFSAFFPNIWPLAGPNIAKRVGRYKNWRGSIDKPILELLTFGSNPDFSDFGVFCACFAHVLRVVIRKPI